MSEGARLAYMPPGPVAAAFMDSRAHVKAIMGPLGSGKTGAALVNGLELAAEQRPNAEGVRKFKRAVIRDTYRHLWKTTMPSWFHWMPASQGEFQGGQDGPAVHTLRWRLPDGSKVECTYEFAAVGDNDVRAFMDGYEPTDMFLNAADTMSIDVLNFGLGRIGRYPKINDGGPSWYGISLDLNAPDTDSPWYDKLFDNLPEGFAVFVQPGGREPGAENIANLPPGYYEAQMAGQEAWYIRRYVDNRFGQSRDGKPIYDDFNDQRHVAPVELLPIAGLPLILGADAGGSPAGVIGQRSGTGQWRILDELVTRQGTGADRFGELLMKLLAERYRDFEVDIGWADPSAAFGVDAQQNAYDWIQALANKTGIRFRGAPTNVPATRWAAVRTPLIATIDGTLPAFLLSPRCKVLRRGFNSGYRFRRIQIAGEQRYEDRADKNEYSHPHDALQYLMVGGGGLAAAMGRKDRAADSRRYTHAITEDSSDGFGGGYGGAHGRPTRAILGE